MNWVLILFVATTGHQTAAPALTTAQYRTEAMCHAAGVKALAMENFQGLLKEHFGMEK